MSVYPSSALSEVCNISMGQAPKGTSYNTAERGYPLIAGAGDFGDLAPVPTKHTDAPTKLSQPGDIVLCIRATIGDRNWSDREYCLGRGVAGLRAKKVALSQAYLWHWLDHAAPVLSAKGRGATFLQVSKADIASLRIPLPPLAEQKRIAGILDAADALRAKRREALAQLDTLLQSTFLDMFGDPVTNPMGWDVKPLKELGRVQTGATPPSKLDGMFGGEIPFVTPSDLKETWVEASRTVTSAGAAKSRTVSRGATLVSCIGAVGKMGKVGEASAFNQQINAVSWEECIADPVGLEMMRFFKAKLAHDAASTTLPILKKSRFEKLLLPVPPFDEQNRFAAIVESIEQQKARQCAHLAELDTLFTSLQARAFRGDL